MSRGAQQLRANLPATSQINTLKLSQYMLHLFLLPSSSDEKLIKATGCGRDIKLLTISFKAASKILKMKLHAILFLSFTAMRLFQSQQVFDSYSWYCICDSELGQIKFTN